MIESLEAIRLRAKHAEEDDREDYKNKMKMGKKRYDEFMKDKDKYKKK